jgi:hypothetical protein
MSTAQQYKIKRSSKTIITHFSFLFLDADSRKCLVTFGPEYFVFKNNMSDKVHQRILKKYFEAFCG